MNTQTTIPLADIRIEVSLQPRVAGLDIDHVRMLQETPDAWPPLLIVQHGSTYTLLDGYHRYAAAQNLGLATVPVTIMAFPDDGDLARLAFHANLTHGLPLTLSDKRARAERLLTEQPHVSNMEIARQIALSPTTVATIRQRLEEAATIAPLEQHVGRGGYIFPVAANPQRPPGTLPEVGVVEQIGDAVGRLFTPAQRTQQRRIVQYLQRLAVALDDQYDLDGWESAGDAAEACRLVLGEERTTTLAERLGPTSGFLYSVALALGYTEESAP